MLTANQKAVLIKNYVHVYVHNFVFLNKSKRKNMKTISVSEFRNNIRKYSELANFEKVIVNRGKGKAFAVVPIDDIEDEGYNPDFVKRILESRDNALKGKYTEIKNTDDIWADILSD